MKPLKSILSMLFCCVVSMATAGTASAEVTKVVLADQLTLAFLPAIVMKEGKLLEKHLKQAGLPNVEVQWATFAGGNTAMDAMLAGQLQIGFTGFMPFAILWSKTHGDVAGIAATSAQPEYFNARNPNLKSIADLTDKDKIALPAVKVSTQAVFLQMAAAERYGMKSYDRFDRLTVSMSQPDATAAVLSGISEIDVAFVSQPYTYQLLKDPRIHTVFNTFQVLGGPATLTLAWTTKKFHDENPKIYAAFLAAYDEALSIINGDKRKAAELYIQRSKSKLPIGDLVKIISDPNVIYTETPQNTMQVMKFMHQIGRIPNLPASWKDMWFPNVHGLPGS